MKSGHPELGKSPYAKYQKAPFLYSGEVRRIIELNKSNQYGCKEVRELTEQHQIRMFGYVVPDGGFK